MQDLLLTPGGDLLFDDTGDIIITNSVRQAIIIRLRWFLGEWRLGPLLGVPYYEDVLVKNPNLARIKQIFRDAILEVEEVDDATVLNFKMNNRTRNAALSFEAIVGEEIIREEVTLDA